MFRLRFWLELRSTIKIRAERTTSVLFIANYFSTSSEFIRQLLQIHSSELSRWSFYYSENLVFTLFIEQEQKLHLDLFQKRVVGAGEGIRTPIYC